MSVFCPSPKSPSTSLWLYLIKVLKVLKYLETIYFLDFKSVNFAVLSEHFTQIQLKSCAKDQYFLYLSSSRNKRAIICALPTSTAAITVDVLST